jgi:hypothetical protein
MNPTVLWEDKTSKMEAASYSETLMDMQYSNVHHIQQDLYFIVLSFVILYLYVKLREVELMDDTATLIIH